MRDPFVVRFSFLGIQFFSFNRVMIMLQPKPPPNPLLALLGIRSPLILFPFLVTFDACDYFPTLKTIPQPQHFCSIGLVFYPLAMAFLPWHISQPLVTRVMPPPLSKISAPTETRLFTPPPLFSPLGATPLPSFPRRDRLTPPSYSEKRSVKITFS